jgi:A/G-specific adenine glycosylase
MREALLRWFDAAARPLPWRREPRDPYATWIVETMSQQTRIDTVVARLPTFLARFPDVAALAGASLDDVLAAWSGLGYYRRARALHAAARVVARERGGRWPTDPDGWLRLPGVGPYTAAAVAAQAFGVPTIALDVNVRRVGARLLGLRAPTDVALRAALAERLLAGGGPAAPDAAAARPDARDEAARVAEALVELGALVCTPRRPRCDACPLRPSCAAAADGDPTRFPAPRRRGPVETLALHAWLTPRAGPDGALRLAFERRAPDGLWGGLHGPPWRADPPPAGARLAVFRHALTHRRVEAVVWRTEAPPADAEVRWLTQAEARAVGLAAIDRRALRLLDGGEAVP